MTNSTLMRVRPFVCCLTFGLVSACGDDGGGESGTTTDSTTTTMTGPTSSPTSTPTGTNTTTPTSTTMPTTGMTTDTGTTTDTTTGGSVECPWDEVAGMPDFGVVLHANGFDRPLAVIDHPEHPGRLFVAEQGGRIKVLEPGESQAPNEVWLQVDSQNQDCDSLCGDTGLLGFAFHPDYPADPRVYVNYQPQGVSRRTRIEEYMVGADEVVDMGSARIVMEIDQPSGNHNGGMMHFGNDGYLYTAFGDGGGQNNAHMTGRDRLALHAKVIRIGVDEDGSMDNPIACAACDQFGPFDYTIPADNPFVNDPSFAPEVWAWGFRNPWRWHFDRPTGDLYLADVGQNQWEWVDVVAAGSDHGWSDMEGGNCFDNQSCDDQAAAGSVNADGLTMPIWEYPHTMGRCSITGGAVYRSCEVPMWDGIYFSTDYCSREMFAITWDGQNTQDFELFYDIGERVVGSGQNAWGDVFFTTVEEDGFNNLVDGKIYRVAPAP